MPKVFGYVYSSADPNSPNTLGTSSASAAQNKRIFNSVVIAGSKWTCVKVPACPEGRLNSFVIQQTAGSNAAAVVDIFQSAAPAAPGTYNTPVAYTSGVPAEVYRVLAQLAVSPGQAKAYRTDTQGVGGYFVNLDNADGHTVKVPSLYVVIVPTGAGGATTWDFGIVLYSDVG